MHAFDGQTDGRTDGRTDRQTEISSLRPRCIPCSAVKSTEYITPSCGSPPEPIDMPFGLWGCVPDLNTHAKFCDNRLRGFSAAAARIWPFPILFLTTLTTVMHYLRLTTRCTNDKNAKLGQRGSRSSHVTYVWNFGTPATYWKRFELETSNLSCQGLRGTNDKMRNWVKFTDPSIFRERFVIETSNLVCRQSTRVTNDKDAKLGQKLSGLGKESCDLLLEF